MPKIPLGSSPQPNPADPSISQEQAALPPLSAIAIPPDELQRLGLADATGTLPQDPHNKITNFVQRVTPAATIAAQKLGVPVEAVISQWALESGWGGSELASKYNNLGGIKALGNSWTGQTINMPSYEKNRSVKEVSPFRVYPSLEAYAQDYISTLSKPRYQAVHGTNSVRDFGMRLSQAGYHQDDANSYVGQLESIARRVAPLLKR